MKTRTAHLASRALLSISGDEAVPFLQNLITCDVEDLKEGDATFGALLTPQGKILFDFLVLREADAFLLDTQADQADDLSKRLMFYRLRAKVDIEADPRDVHVRWPVSGDGFADPRHDDLGERLPGPHEPDAAEADWNALRVSYGVPQLGTDFAAGTTFPHEALMDQYDDAGVDFSKGCYVGQEVVSRMQHRGTARSRFILVSGPGGSRLPDAGAAITTDGRSVGTMGSSVDNDGLALLRLDRVAQATRNEIPLMCVDMQLQPRLPDFVTFSWPDA